MIYQIANAICLLYFIGSKRFLPGYFHFDVGQIYKYALSQVDAHSHPRERDSHIKMAEVLVVLYSAVNDPDTANDPQPQIIPKLDRKKSQDRK